MKIKLKNLLLLATAVALGFTSCDLESLNQNIQTKMDVKAPLESSSNKSVDGENIYTFNGSASLSLDDNTDIQDNIASLEGLILDSIKSYFSFLPTDATIMALQAEIVYKPNANAGITTSELEYVTSLNMVNLAYCQITERIYQRLFSSILMEGSGTSISDLNTQAQAIITQVVEVAPIVAGVPNFSGINLDQFLSPVEGISSDLQTFIDRVMPPAAMDPNMPSSITPSGSAQMDAFSVENLNKLFTLMKDNDYEGEISFSVNGIANFDLNLLDIDPELNLELYATIEINGADFVSGN